MAAALIQLSKGVTKEIKKEGTGAQLERGKQYVSEGTASFAMIQCFDLSLSRLTALRARVSYVVHRGRGRQINSCWLVDQRREWLGPVHL